MEQHTLENTTTTDTPLTVEKLYPEGTLYRGKVLSHDLVTDFKGQPQLVVGIELEGAMIDRNDPDSSVIAFKNKPKVKTIIRFPVDPDDPGATNQWAIAIRDLEKIGFVGDDLETLNPDHKSFVSFVGRIVYVTPKHSEYNGKTNTFWNLWSVRAKDIKPVAKGDLTKKGLAKSFKAAKAELQSGGGVKKDVPF